MERKIGETFEYEDKKLQVKESASSGCGGCFFDEQRIPCSKNVAGYCDFKFRADKKKVIFVEVNEQPQKEIEVVNERKVGEVFEFEGKTLKVVETIGSTCYNCYFEVRDCDCENTRKVLGACLSETRTDNKPVIFVEVKKETKEQPQEEQEKEQPQAEQQPQKLNLCEILRDCPKGEMFWSPVFGNVWFYDIDKYTKRVKVKASGVGSWYINADGTITIDKVTSPEIMLYPSRKQRDWSKFIAPWLNKWRFDPKTLKAFDKVLVRSENIFNWNCSLFSNIDDFSSKYPFTCLGLGYKYCIPYNDETKHLVGTTDEAPDFYRYWED